MEEKLVSVIVPIYNVEQYLHKCIGSIISQTYKNLQIILIDDDSQDKSLKICREFMKKDSRISVISNSNNSGVGYTRNVGIKESNGYYIMFVDSDDFLPTSAIKNLVMSIENDNVDLSCGLCSKITVKKSVPNRYKLNIINTSDKENLAKYLEIDEVNGPWAKLFKASIIKNNNLLFPVDMRIGEDAVFSYQYILKCNKVCIINKNVYYYNKLNDSSITHNYYDKFNWCCLQCAIEQSNNIAFNDYDNILSQKIFYNRFKSALYYTMHYDIDKSVALTELKNTYNFFKPFLRNDIILENYEKFDDKSILSLLNNNDFENFYVTNHIKANKSFFFKLKRHLVSFILRYKTFKIFKIDKNKFDL